MARSAFKGYLLLLVLMSSGVAMAFLLEDPLGSFGVELVGGVTLYFFLELYWRKYLETRADGISLDYNELISDIEKAENELIVYSTFSYLFDSEYEGDEKHSKYKKIDKGYLWERVSDILRNKVAENNSFKIKILLLDPASEAAKQRNRERLEYHKEDDIVTALNRNLSELWDFVSKPGVEKYQNRILIKVSNLTPRFQMHKIDNRMIVGFYPEGKSALLSGNNTLLNAKTPAGKIFLDAFFEVWNPEDQNLALSVYDYRYTTLELVPLNERTHKKQEILRVKYIDLESRGIIILLKEGDKDNVLFNQEYTAHYQFKPRKNGMLYNCVEKIKDPREFLFSKNYANQDVDVASTVRAKYGDADYEFYHLSRPSKEKS